MKIILISIIITAAIFGVVYAGFSYQETYDKNCIDKGGKVTGFLRCTKIHEDFALPNPFIVGLEFGKTFQNDELEIKFYDIEDSRCPLDVTCVWEGNVTAMIHVSNQTHGISYPTPIEFTITHFDPYEITLKDIQPHPTSTQKPDYVATLEITKLSETESVHIISDTPEIFSNGITKFVNPNHESLKYYKTTQVIDDTYLGKNVQQWQDAWDWELEANYEIYKDEFYEELGRLLVKNEITQVMNQVGIVNVNDDISVHQGYSLLSLPPHIGFTSVINATDGNSYLVEASSHSNQVSFYAITQLTFFDTTEELSLIDIINSPQQIHIYSEDENKSKSVPSVLIIYVDDNTVHFVNNTPETIRIQESGTGEIAREHELAWIGPIIPPFENGQMIFDKSGIYEWDARTAPTFENPLWWDSHAGGDVIVLADDVDDLPLEDRLRMGRSILQNSEIPTAGMGVGNADNALKVSLRSAVYDMLPDAVSYYQDRAEQLVPFDIPIIIENPYGDK